MRLSAIVVALRSSRATVEKSFKISMTSSSRQSSHVCCRWSLSLLGVCLHATPTAVFADCVRYSVQTMQSPCSPSSTTPFSVNDRSDVVGWASCGPYGASFVAWNAESPQLLLLPGAYTSTALDISNDRHIVGYLEGDSLGHRGFLFQNGQCITLDWLPGHNWSEAHAVSDAGIAVGYSADVQGPGAVACRWVAGVVEALALPIGPTSQANAISSNGALVGWMGVSPGGSFYSEAFLWNDGDVAILARPDGATSAEAKSVNSNNEVCGAFWFQSSGVVIAHPILWTKSDNYIDLGLLPNFLRGWALSINDFGHTVGYCQNPPQLGNNVQGFIWRESSLASLDLLLAPGSTQYHIRHAWAINDAGQIAASVTGGGFSGSALLTPVPPRPGDTNCDWLVNVTDLLAVINAWGPAPPQVPFEGSPDLNIDGNVNVQDLLAIITDWG